MASKKQPRANAPYKKWMKPSAKPPKNLKNPATDWYSEQGDNVTRPKYDPKKDGTPNDNLDTSS